jgi:hypothetical protein
VEIPCCGTEFVVLEKTNGSLIKGSKDLGRVFMDLHGGILMQLIKKFWNRF